MVQTFSACNGHWCDFNRIPIPQTALNSACSVKHKDMSQDVSSIPIYVLEMWLYTAYKFQRYRLHTGDP